MCEYEEARKRSDQKTMLSETWRETFGNSFQELRRAIFTRDFEDIAEWVDHIESTACNVVQQFDSAWQRAENNKV